MGHREHSYQGVRQTPVATYWENRVLGVTDDIHTQGNMRWEILGCLAIAWILVCESSKIDSPKISMFRKVFTRKFNINQMI